MQAAKQIRLSRNARRSSAVRSSRSSCSELIHLKQNSALRAMEGMFSHRVERLRPLLLVRHVGVEQVEVELHVHGLLEQLPGQVQPAFRGVDVLVQVEDEVVGHDRVAGGEERDQPGDQVPLGRRQPGQVGQVGVQVHLLDRPGVLDRVAEPVVEHRVPHRPQGQVHAGVEEHGPVHSRVTGRPHRSRGSQGSRPGRRRLAVGRPGLGRGRRVATATVACWMRVAGRERR